MRERGMRILDPAPKARRCAIASVPIAIEIAHGATVHQ